MSHPKVSHLQMSIRKSLIRKCLICKCRCTQVMPKFQLRHRLDENVGLGLKSRPKFLPWYLGAGRYQWREKYRLLTKKSVFNLKNELIDINSAITDGLKYENLAVQLFLRLLTRSCLSAQNLAISKLIEITSYKSIPMFR